jgi:hypothetical protein
MCSIYSRAASTIIYLGDSNILSKGTFEQYRRGVSSSRVRGNDILNRPWFTRVWVFQGKAKEPGENKLDVLREKVALATYLIENPVPRLSC